jgi:hypothetical protein
VKSRKARVASGLARADESVEVNETAADFAPMI